MGYFTYKAEKGAAHALWYFIKIAFFAAFALWPLAIGATDNYKHLSAIGIGLEVVWVIVLGLAAVVIGSQRRGRSRR